MLIAFIPPIKQKREGFLGLLVLAGAFTFSSFWATVLPSLF